VHPDALSAPLLARCTFPPAGTSVVAGLSGGPDSTAMVGLAVAAGCRVTAIHVDHGLRPDSAAEVDLVVALAGVLGADVRTVRVDVVPGPNLEARARAARLAALGPSAMTGHTLDDQAETMLLRLVRGSGGRGLAAMRSGATKPILALRRWETRQWCEAVGLVPLLDPSNADPRHRRNRIRAEAIPLLDDLADRDVAPLLARTATLLGEDEALLEDLAAAIDPTVAAALVAAPLPLARRAVRAWLARDGYPPDAATVERVLAVARGDAVATEVGDGASVRRSAGRLSRVDATS
jgi:tRNA(Ile)-lysidine synthase